MPHELSRRRILLLRLQRCSTHEPMILLRQRLLAGRVILINLADRDSAASPAVHLLRLPRGHEQRRDVRLGHVLLLLAGLLALRLRSALLLQATRLRRLLQVVLRAMLFGEQGCLAVEDVQDLPLERIDHALIIADVMRHSPTLDGLLQGAMHFASAKSDLLDLLDDEVAEYGNGLAVLAINQELATAGILVHGDEGATI